MQFNLTKYQENQKEILDPILQENYWQDDGNLAKVIVSHLGVTPTNHTLKYNACDVVSCVISSSDEFIVTGHNYYGKINIWDTATGNRIRTIQGHPMDVNTVRLLSDDSALISGGYNRVLHMYNIATGKRLRTFEGHTNYITDCCIPSTDDIMVSASADNMLKLWNILTGACTQTLVGHTDTVTTCCISSTSTFIVSASSDGTIKRWDVVTGVCTMTLHGHQEPISTCCLDSADQCIISADTANTLKVWDVSAGTCTHTLPNFGKRITLSVDGQRIIAYRARRPRTPSLLRTWNKETGDIYTKEIDHYVCSMRISSDDQFLVCGTYGMVQIRETKTLDLYHHD